MCGPTQDRHKATGRQAVSSQAPDAGPKPTSWRVTLHHSDTDSRQTYTVSAIDEAEAVTRAQAEAHERCVRCAYRLCVATVVRVEQESDSSHPLSPLRRLRRLLPF